MWVRVSVVALILPSVLALFPPGSGDTSPSHGALLSPTETELLGLWYQSLGVPRPDETFGDFLIRTALLKWHSPYAHLKETTRTESLQVDLTSFDCVSFIETSLAVARCAWQRNTTEACFIKELIATRYRNGMMGDFASRLHYLEDWIDDNSMRRRLEDPSEVLGGLRLRRRFSYMSEHPHQYPAMADPRIRAAIRHSEARLSARIYTVTVRASIREKEHLLLSGDLVGIVTTEPGRLISHAGLVARNGEEKAARLLHASSHHGRVIVTGTRLTDYVFRRRERWGIVTARPVPPPPRSASRPDSM